MALAFALRSLRDERDVCLTGPAAFRAHHPPAYEVDIIERTSWSCSHGVERWRADCGCRVGGQASWTQAWRAPLRRAIDWLRDELAALYEARTGEVLRDPWGARDRYIECVLDPRRTAGYLAAEASRPLSPAATLQARRALELARHALFMQTSCGWFFDELTGLELVQVLRHAACAIELAETLGRHLEDGFVERLEPARSNRGESGAEVYRRAARGEAATPARVAATAAMLTLLGQEVGVAAEVPGYELGFSAAPQAGRLVADARVCESVTGAVVSLPVVAELSLAGPPGCRAGDATFTLGDLFGVQRERLLDALGRRAAAAARAARLAALEEIRPLLGPLLERETVLPSELAALLGWKGAEAIVAAMEDRGAPLSRLVPEAAALRRRGAVFPASLAKRIALALAARLEGLPETAGEALALLDLGEAAGVRLDLGRAQVQTLAWWQASPASARAQAPLGALRERLGLGPEEPPAP